MPLDASIISNVAAPDFSGAIATGVNMAALAQQRQMQNLEMQQKQQAFNEQQALKNAQNKNTKVNDDGSVQQDTNGTMKDLVSAGYAQLVPQYAQEQATRAYTIQKQQLEKQQEQHSYVAQLASGTHDQASWDKALQQAQAAGIPTDQIPKQFDPSIRNSIIYSSLSAKDNLANQIAQQEASTKKVVAENEGKRLDFEIGKFNTDRTDKMASEMKNDLDANRSRAGNYGEIAARFQNGQRLNTLVGSFKGGNLPPAQMEELGLGLANMLTGSSGAARSQVEALVPKSAVGDASKIAQWWANDPKGANQQKFVAMMGHTVNREMSLAQQQMTQIQQQRLSAYEPLRKAAPERYNPILNEYTKPQPNGLQGQDNQNVTPHPTQKMTSHSNVPIGTVSNGLVKTANGWVPQGGNLNATK